MVEGVNEPPQTRPTTKVSAPSWPAEVDLSRFYESDRGQLDNVIASAMDLTVWSLEAKKDGTSVYVHCKNNESLSYSVKAITRVAGTVHNVMECLRALDDGLLRQFLRRWHSKSFVDSELLCVDHPESFDPPLVERESMSLKWMAFASGKTSLSRGKEFCVREYCTVLGSHPQYGTVGVCKFESYDGVGARYSVRAKPDTYSLTVFEPSSILVVPTQDDGMLQVTMTFSMRKARGKESVSPGVKALALRFAQDLEFLPPAMQHTLFQPTTLAEKHTWVRDKQRSNCSLCVQSFSMIRRKHHCRVCGEIVCSSCTLFKTMTGKDAADVARVRVCKACLGKSSTTDVSLVVPKLTHSTSTVSTQSSSSSSSMNVNVMTTTPETLTLTRTSSRSQMSMSMRNGFGPNSNSPRAGSRSTHGSTTASASASASASTTFVTGPGSTTTTTGFKQPTLSVVSSSSGTSSSSEESRRSGNDDVESVGTMPYFQMHRTLSSLYSKKPSFSDSDTKSVGSSSPRSTHSSQQSYQASTTSTSRSGGRSDRRTHYFNEDFADICQLAMETMGCIMAGIRTDDVELVNFSDGQLHPELPRSLPTFRRIASRGKPCIVLDVSADQRIAGDRRASAKLQFFVGIPLIMDGEVIGDLCVADRFARDSIDYKAVEVLMVLGKTVTRYMAQEQFHEDLAAFKASRRRTTTSRRDQGQSDFALASTNALAGLPHPREVAF